MRDKIPSIIEREGKKIEIYVAPKQEHTSFLVKKLTEEMNEFIESKTLEELADIMEVLFGLAKSLGYTEQDLINKRLDKKIQKGGFENNIVLKKVWN